jgi:hypothetical protein
LGDVVEERSDVGAPFAFEGFDLDYIGPEIAERAQRPGTPKLAGIS